MKILVVGAGQVGSTIVEALHADLLPALRPAAGRTSYHHTVGTAVAEALGVRPWQVALLRGATSRDKLLEIRQPPPDLAARIVRSAIEADEAAEFLVTAPRS